MSAPSGEAHAILEGSVTAPAQARGLVSDTLGELGQAASEIVERARLVASELVSIAVRHGSPRVALTVRAGDQHVRIEVAEQTVELGAAPATAVVEGDRDDEWTARIVEAMATRQGRDMRSDGMTLWAEIARG